MEKQTDLVNTSTKTLSQIAEEYHIHRNTLRRRLKKLNIKLPRGLLYPHDVQKIYDALGNPKKI